MATGKKAMPAEQAWSYADLVKNILDDHGIQSEICGSLRRKKDMVNDIDMVVGEELSTIIDLLREMFPDVKIIVSGNSKADVAINSIPFNFYKAEPHYWGAMVLFLTGSKEFNILCRGRAKKRNLKLNQYGLWTANGNQLITTQEKTILRKLGLFGDYSNPERR